MSEDGISIRISYQGKVIEASSENLRVLKNSFGSMSFYSALPPILDLLAWKLSDMAPEIFPPPEIVRYERKGE